MSSKARIDWYLYVLLIMPIILLTYVLILSEGESKYEMMITIPFMLLVYGFAFVGSYYELKEDHLLIKLGVFKKRIPYVIIDKCYLGKLMRNTKTAFSHTGIVIELKERKYFFSKFLIATKEDEDFMYALEHKLRDNL